MDRTIAILHPGEMGAADIYRKLDEFKDVAEPPSLAAVTAALVKVT